MLKPGNQMLSRRTFLRRSGEAALLVALPAVTPVGCAGAAATAKPDVLVNHVGFASAGQKLCMVPGTQPAVFSVVDAVSGRRVREGPMTPRGGDLGNYLVGDFSDLAEAGSYRVQVGSASAGTFAIADDIYLPAVKKCIEYFARQRCGDSRSGHHAPCHLDDGRRQDNGREQDASGGWHDACDLRKWVDATIYGMIGLSRALDAAGPGQLDRERVIDELRWGNSYFRKLQEPDGYVMDYCGGDDGNRYTDNRPGSGDERSIHVEPCALPAQFHFVAAQGALVRLTRDADAPYARGCEEAARRCLEWCATKRSPGAATSLAAGMIACVELHRAIGWDRAKQLAAEFARRLLSLQVTAVDEGTPVGFFRTAPDKPEPSREIQHGNLPLIALAEIVEHFAEHPDAGRWRAALQSQCDYLTAMAGRSAFGTIPFGLYSGNDPGGHRRVGSYWYRWFMKQDGETAAKEWWVGINAHLASNGVGLARAARVLKNPQLAYIAQRQLDWILGVNPFNASTVTDIGCNQPRLYTTGQFAPPTPLIPGGVMNGLGGSADDEVLLAPGSWNTCEYWTPMVGYTMWLMSELQRVNNPANGAG